MIEFYEKLELQALKLDEPDGNLAEKIRELMDFIWRYHLSIDDKKFLNSRESLPID